MNTMSEKKATATVLSLSTSQQKAKRQALDAQIVHELSREKLLSLKAHHISSIFQNCIGQIEIAATVPAVHYLDNVSTAVDKELNRALQVHQTLSEGLETSQSHKQELDGPQAGQVGEVKRREVSQLESDFKNSLRDLLRLFRAHPDASFGLSTEVGESERALIKGLKTFHGQFVEKFQTRPDEELKLEYCKPVFLSRVQNMQLKEEETTAALKLIVAEISDKNEEINKEINMLERSLQESKEREAELLLVEGEKWEIEQVGIQRKIDQLNIQMNHLAAVGKQTERELHLKNTRVEVAIEYFQRHSDNEIGQKQAALEIHEMDNEELKEKLRKLEEPYRVLEVEYNQIVERRRMSAEKRKKEMRGLELKNKAATAVQACWRRYCGRKALKSQAKSEKAKARKDKRMKKKKRLTSLMTHQS